MMKVKLIMMLVKFVMGAIALGVGIWYISSSIGGASLTYASTKDFLVAVGAGDGNIAHVNGCFLCGYVRDLFGVIGTATDYFWDKIVNALWIVMAIGFGIFLIIHTGQYLYDALKKTAKLDTSAKDLEFQPWFDKVWRQGARIMIVGTMIGALGMGGTPALRTISYITITPVMYIGTELSLIATGAVDGASCATALDTAAPSTTSDSTDILNPIMEPFMCVIGNLNMVMLAGAAGGFALMNYSWMHLGGGLFTWLAGLALVIMFLIIGFDLFFKILTVIFRLIFVIIFMPIFLASTAFNPVWKVAGNLVSKGINMVVGSMVTIITTTLKIVIMFAIVSFAADAYFPGPVDGYSAIFPPLFGHTEAEISDSRTMSVMAAFQECEEVSLVDGVVNADKFKECFLDKKAQIEAVHPGAFDFMDDGWDFMMMMIGVFALYFYAIRKKVDAMFKSDSGIDFDFGGWVNQVGKTIWAAPQKLVSWVGAKFAK